MSIKESGVNSSDVRAYNPDVLIYGDERLSQREKDFHFGMQSNGYFLKENGDWEFSSATTAKLAKSFKGQNVSFFGPNLPPLENKFFSDKETRFLPMMISIFKQETVTDAIRKYRDIDEDQAARIAFLLGGMVRFESSEFSDPINAAKFVARMTRLGERKSADAIASAMAMYVLSGGSLKENVAFVGNIYHMGEVIAKDPVTVGKTTDLGLSQVARLRHFLDTIYAKRNREFPDIKEQEMAFYEFPTVGAEFHFAPDAPQEYPNFWERLAFLNMSQYQRGSYIQLSRNDRGVIEVRMNPSIYPIAIANWNYMRYILPELNQAFFTVTINRREKNFSWESDRQLLDKLRGLGMLSYAGLFIDIPRQERSEEIDFGNVYLGQTVKMQDGEYDFSGAWMGKEGRSGQMGIYAGFGDNFPYLTYYLSMALVKPDILRGVFKKGFVPSIRTLKAALALEPRVRKDFFKTIQNHIEADKRLSNASEAGQRIVELLKPSV